jgi:hypothetical protein
MRYVINKGKHRSTLIPTLTIKDSINGVFTFIDGYKYLIEKQKDSNKLIGLSDNWSHHIDSARIGWRYNPRYPEMIEMVAIIYHNTKRTIFAITHVEPNKKNYFSIEILDDYYKIRINKTVVAAQRKSSWDFVRYQLNPYFGGTTPSPNEVLIDLEVNFE